jgi:hypothetical protein
MSMSREDVERAAALAGLSLTPERAEHVQLAFAGLWPALAALADLELGAREPAITFGPVPRGERRTEPA